MAARIDEITRGRGVDRVIEVALGANAALDAQVLATDGVIAAYASDEDNDTVFVVSLADRKVVRQIKTTRGAGPDPVMELPD